VTPQPGLYVGSIRHRRFAPAAHAFRYPIFMALVDVDRLPETMAVSRLTAYNRWNLAAFDERDHLGDPSRPLRERLRESAAGAGVALPDGKIFLLTHLRYAGYVFNPISLFYCYAADGTLRRVMAEVNNTYGGRRCYWLSPLGDTSRRFRATAAKALYVSPFMEFDVDYGFVLTPPGEALGAHLTVMRREHGRAGTGLVFDATLTLERRPWTARSVRTMLLRYPLMTAQVIAAIHWEALRLRLKGLAVVPFPSEASQWSRH
jgi:DUF1365 family protein